MRTISMDWIEYLTKRRSTKEERDRKLDRNWATTLALLPAFVAGWMAFGPRVFTVLYVTIIPALISDTLTAYFLLKKGKRTFSRVFICCLGQFFLGHWMLMALLITACLPPDVSLWVPAFGGLLGGGFARLAERSRFPRLVSPALAVLAILYAMPFTGLIRHRGRVLAARQIVSLKKSARFSPSTDSSKTLLADDWRGRNITGRSVNGKRFRDMLRAADPDIVNVDAVSEATPLSAARGTVDPATGKRVMPNDVSFATSLFGYVPGTIAETNVIALILGMIILVMSGYIPIRLALLIPAAVLIFSVSFIFDAAPWTLYMGQRVTTNAIFMQITAGGVFLTPFFFTTHDYRPRSGLGQTLFALALGLLIALGRGLLHVDVTIFAMLIVGVIWPKLDRWAVQVSGEVTEIVEDIGGGEAEASASQTAEVSQVRIQSASRRFSPLPARLPKRVQKKPSATPEPPGAPPASTQDNAISDTSEKDAGAVRRHDSVSGEKPKKRDVVQIIRREDFEKKTSERDAASQTVSDAPDDESKNTSNDGGRSDDSARPDG